MKAAKKTRKVQTNKTNCMSDEAFAELKEALEDALAFERGQHRDLKIMRIQAPSLTESNVIERHPSPKVHTALKLCSR